MSEISKTAEAARKAVERGQKKEVKELTVEDRLSNIKKNLDAGLFVPPDEVKLLWEKYFEAMTEILQLRAALNLRPLTMLQTAILAGNNTTESTAHKAVEELETIPK